MRVSILALCLLSAVALVACGGGGSGTTIADYEGAITSNNVAGGAEVYETFCEGCHPGGAKGDGPAINGIGWSPAQTRMRIREGKKEMPGFGPDKISAGELEAVLAYLVKSGTVKP